MPVPNPQLEKKLNRWAYAVSAVVLALVAAMGSSHKIQTGIDFSFLPPFHSACNAVCAVLLVVALVAIKNGNMERHRRLIYAAMAMSALFLLSYVTYHFTTPPTLFGDSNHDHVLSPEEKSAVGGLRTAYLVLLNLHIVVAAVSFPFILLTFVRAYTNQFDRHKRMARWTWWAWFFVAATGPICYLLLRPYY